jgi:hypothetical protein
MNAQEKMTITNGIIILKHRCPFEPIKLNKGSNCILRARGSISFIAYQRLSFERTNGRAFQ